MDGLSTLLMLGSSLIMIVYFSKMGIGIFVDASKETTNSSLRPFLFGLAASPATIASLEIFWIGVVILGGIVPIEGVVLFVVSIIHAVLCAIFIAGSHIWWKGIAKNA